MTRGLSSAAEAAATSEVVSLCWLVYLDFESGPVRVTSLPHVLMHDADGNGVEETWLGVGNLGGVSPIEETSQVEATSATLSLSAIPPEQIAVALGEHYQGRICNIYLAFLNPDDSHEVIDSFLLWSALMDTMELTLGETAECRLTVESPLARWNQPLQWTWSDEDQQSFYPGDKGFQFVNMTVEKEIRWGRFGPG